MGEMRFLQKETHSQTNISEWDEKDIQSSQVFHENWCKKMIWAGMYSGRLYPAISVICCIVHFTFLNVNIYHSLRIDYELALFSASLNYNLMIFSVTCSIINCQVYKSYIENILRWIHADFHDYKDTIDPETDEEIQAERLEMKTRKQKVARSYNYLFILTGISTILVFPLVFEPPNQDKVDIINRNLPVPLYYPMRSDTWPKRIVCVLAEFWTAGIIVLVVSGTDIPFSCFTEEGVFQLKKLGLTIRHSQRRARYMYKKLYNKEDTFQNDPKFMECLQNCLNHSVKHHYVIIKYFKSISEHYFYILLIIMTGSTFLLCVSGILYVSDDVGKGVKLQSILFLVAILFHTFTFTWYGEMISQTCWLVRQQIYEVDWTTSSRELKSYMIIMMAYFNRPITLNVGGFMISNLSTFGNHFYLRY
nr:olfactory receptor 9 [Tropidothorax elegans]